MRAFCPPRPNRWTWQRKSAERIDVIGSQSGSVSQSSMSAAILLVAICAENRFDSAGTAHRVPHNRQVLLTAKLYACSPNSFLIAYVSSASFIGVEEPCALIIDLVVGNTGITQSPSAWRGWHRQLQGQEWPCGGRRMRSVLTPQRRYQAPHYEMLGQDAPGNNETGPSLSGNLRGGVKGRLARRIIVGRWHGTHGAKPAMTATTSLRRRRPTPYQQRRGRSMA